MARTSDVTDTIPGTGRDGLDLTGKAAYVTGATEGIGRAIALTLHRAGARVAVSGLPAVGIEELHEELGNDALIVIADLTDPIATEQANREVADWAANELHILVNNVGRGGANDFRTSTDRSWDQSFQLNLMAHVRTLHYFIDMFTEQAAIVSIASDLAKQPEAVPIEYGAMKAALVNLTRSLAGSLAPIRVNAVLPGPVWTPLWHGPGGLLDELALRDGVSRDVALEAYLEGRHMPLGFVQPDDVADVVHFLVSPLSRGITGAGIDVGGTVRGI